MTSKAGQGDSVIVRPNRETCDREAEQGDSVTSEAELGDSVTSQVKNSVSLMKHVQRKGK